MDAARPHPPSDQRIAEARASGHLPNAPLAAFIAGLGAVLAAAGVLAPRFAHGFGELLEAPLTLAASGRTPEALARLAAAGQRWFGAFALAFAGVFAAIALGRALTQAFAFAPLAGSRTKRFAPLTPGRTGRALFGLCLALCTALALWEVAQLERPALGALARSWAERVVLLGLACALIDVAFARARFFGSLWLTRREYLDEQREAFGAPELRAARRRLAHEDAGPR